MYTQLTNDQKEFLKNYQPEDRMFTSMEEIELILEHIEPTREVRNLVVLYYTDLMKNYGLNDYMIAMQSVTAAIDYKIGAF